MILGVSLRKWSVIAHFEQLANCVKFVCQIHVPFGVIKYTVFPKYFLVIEIQFHLRFGNRNDNESTM